MGWSRRGQAAPLDACFGTISSDGAPQKSAPRPKWELTKRKIVLIRALNSPPGTPPQARRQSNRISSFVVSVRCATPLSSALGVADGGCNDHGVSFQVAPIFGRNWARFGGNRARLGRFRANSGPSSADIWPNFAEIGPDLVEVGPLRSDLAGSGQIWAEFGRRRPPHRPKPANIWSLVGRSG